LLVELDISSSAVDRVIGEDQLPHGAPPVSHETHKLPDWLHYQDAMNGTVIIGLRSRRHRNGEREGQRPRHLSSSRYVALNLNGVHRRSMTSSSFRVSFPLCLAGFHHPLDPSAPGLLMPDGLLPERHWHHADWHYWYHADLDILRAGRSADAAHTRLLSAADNLY
jgi:hypothetical protein